MADETKVEQPDLDSIEDENLLAEALQAQVDAARAAEAGSEDNTLEQSEAKTDPVVVSDDSDTGETNAENSNEGDEVGSDSFDFDFTDEAVLNKPFKTPMMVKRKGVEIPVNNFKEALELLPKSIDYTAKMQQIAPHRKTIEYMDQYGLTMSDLQRIAEIKSGNKDALASLAKEAKIDVWDVDTDADYKPSNEFEPLEPNMVEEVAQEIMADESWANEVKQITAYVPDAFKQTLATDANVLRGFAEDVRNGVAKQLVPEAIKINAMNPNMNFIQAYMQAGDKILGNAAPEANTPPAATLPPKTAPSVDASTRAKAGSPKASQSSGKVSVDLWEDGISESELASRIQMLANQHRQ